tara:strand:+ start:412 stop:579 length:168 start_codon:yes stop_codon:yes gene_type:complete
MMPLDPMFGDSYIAILIYTDQLVTSLESKKTKHKADLALEELLQLCNECEDKIEH